MKEMNKTYLIIIIVVALLGTTLGVVLVKNNYVRDQINVVVPIFLTPTPEPTPTPVPATPTPTPKPSYQDIPAGENPQNATYLIDNEFVTLVDGKVEKEIPNSAAKEITQIKEQKLGDLNGDGIEDTALILTRTTGGTGTYYYVAAALKVKDQSLGTNAYLLADRPEAVSLDIEADGTIKVAYDKKESGATDSAVKTEVKYYRVELPNHLVEVEK